MAHVARVGKSDPAHARDELEERGGSYIVRGIIFAIVDEGRNVDFRDTWDTGPALQRAARY